MPARIHHLYKRFESCLTQAKVGMYADDTHVTITPDNMEELLEMAQEEM